MFVIPHVGLIVLCSVSDDVQEKGVGYVLGGIEQPHVRWGVSGKGGEGGNVFEIMGYYSYFVCTAYGWGRWVLGVILWDGSEEPLFYAGHVRLNVLLMGQAW